MGMRDKTAVPLCPTCGRKLFMGSPPADTAIAKAVRAKRIAERLDLRRAADTIGISPSTLCRVEAGKGFDVDSAVKIAEWLGKSLDELFMKRRVPK